MDCVLMKNGPANASWPEIKCVLLSFSSLGHILTEEEKIELPMPKTKFNFGDPDMIESIRFFT